jgi:tRNA A-37 threonylcarbamoyl transferase component Bud32
MDNTIWTLLQQGIAPKGLCWLNKHRIEINSDYQSLLKTMEMDTLQKVIDSKQGTLVSADRQLAINYVRRIEVDFKGKTRVFYLKVYRNYRLKILWNKAFRGFLIGRSIARAEYENLEKLAEYCIRTPQLVAWGDHRFASGVIHSFIMTEEIPQAMGLDTLFKAWITKQPKKIVKDKQALLIRAAAKSVRQMHDNGFEHHDLFLRNMMISENDMSKLYILDAPRAYIWPQFIMNKRRTVDLATLDAATTETLSRSQRMRFMHLYLKHKRLSNDDKQLLRDILQRAQPLRKRQLDRLEIG